MLTLGRKLQPALNELRYMESPASVSSDGPGGVRRRSTRDAPRGGLATPPACAIKRRSGRAPFELGEERSAVEGCAVLRNRIRSRRPTVGASRPQGISSDPPA